MKQLLFLILALPILAAAQANDGCGAVPYTAAGAFAGSAGPLGTALGFHFSRNLPLNSQGLYGGLGAEALYLDATRRWHLPISASFCLVHGVFGYCPTLIASGGYAFGATQGPRWLLGGGITRGNAQATISYAWYRFSELPASGFRFTLTIIQ